MKCPIDRQSTEYRDGYRIAGELAGQLRWQVRRRSVAGI
jgi:hypothetical protein